MEKERVIEEIQLYVQPFFTDDTTGHDYEHMKRVARWSHQLAAAEGADVFTAEAAGWLHDIGDKKLFENPKEALESMYSFLESLPIESETIENIRLAVKDVSFSKGDVPQTLEGKIVQDADRLDAIGAIGMARTFAFGGAKGQLLYGEGPTSIQHFYDKLLRLASGMHTNTAKKEADKRHQFMLNYLEQFFREWNIDNTEGTDVSNEK
ncbi:HD domain-containing protein [Halobacillus sp. Marseille-Q1614]|uniref:HD domain-containing protein n=1 Tax=Halobacillus sp. Marseille-Q1614 TaxID=2709134 RepID=UPI00156FC41A|nr:HD domain-containing protein [Halobacillus sp. Marseille-Q1614]